MGRQAGRQADGQVWVSEAAAAVAVAGSSAKAESEKYVALICGRWAAQLWGKIENLPEMLRQKIYISENIPK